jgi:hypothetical protein
MRYQNHRYRRVAEKFDPSKRVNISGDSAQLQIQIQYLVGFLDKLNALVANGEKQDDKGQEYSCAWKKDLDTLLTALDKIITTLTSISNRIK